MDSRLRGNDGVCASHDGKKLQTQSRQRPAPHPQHHRLSPTQIHHRSRLQRSGADIHHAGELVLKTVANFCRVVERLGLVAHDHRAVKRITDPMLGFKSFWGAKRLIAGIETCT